MALPQALFLDFDGVVLESVDAKTQAMGQLFAGRPEHVEKIVRFHLDNAGVSRYDKFHHFYREYFKEPLDDAEMARLDKEFSALVRKRVLTCPFVPGARELLERWSGRIPMHVVSATPEPELREIVRERGLERFFRSVNGAPAKKGEHVARILQAAGLDPKRCFFVGDAAADGKAAAANGVPFVLRLTQGAPREALELPAAARLPDLTGLPDLWRAESASCRLAWSALPPARLRALGDEKKPARWAYLGRSWTGLTRWEAALGPGFARLDIGERLQAQAAAARQPYLRFLSELAARHGRSPEWWLSRVSDENTLAGSVFSDLCWLLTARALLREEAPTLLVAENEAVLEVLERDEPSCVRVRSALERPARLRRRARQAARWLRFFWDFWRRRRAAAATRSASPLPARDGRPLALVHACVEPGYFSRPGGKDAYFGELPDFLERRGYQVVSLPWLNNPGRPLAEAFAWFRAQPARFLMADDFYSAGDCLRAAAAVLRSARLPEGPQRVEGLPCKPDGLDITPLVAAAKGLQRSNIGAAEFALYPLLFEKLAAAGWKPDLFLDTFENTLYEKVSIQALRRLCAEARVAGFVHWSAVPPLMLQHVAVPDPKLSPLPDVIVCNSSFMRDFFAASGFPEDRLAVGPSLRFAHLLGERAAAEPEPRTVFVGLSLEPESTAEMLSLLRQAFPEAAGLIFWVKPHPQMTAEQWKCLTAKEPLPSHMQVVSGPVGQWVDRASCAVVGASTVSMDFALAGVPLVPVGRAAVLDFNPLANFPDLPPVVRGPVALRREVLRQAGLSAAECAQLRGRAAELRARCLSPINEHTLSAFVVPPRRESIARSV